MQTALARLLEHFPGDRMRGDEWATWCADHLIHALVFAQRDSLFAERLPVGLLEALYAKVLRTELLCARLDHELERVAANFAANGIPFAVLKGPALAYRFYRDQPTLRPYSDLDLLLAPSEQSAAASSLLRLGYQRVSSYSRKDALAANSAIKEEWEIPGDHDARIELHFGVHARSAHLTSVGVDAMPSFAWRGHALRHLPLGVDFSFLCRHVAEQHTFQKFIWLIDLHLIEPCLSLDDRLVAAQAAELWHCGSSVQSVHAALAEIQGHKFEEGWAFGLWRRVYGAPYAPRRKTMVGHYLLKCLLRDSLLDAARYGVWALGRRVWTPHLSPS